ncbi:MAG: hypothetical protein HC923_04145 [Myxococcales bacterium]|nr:hypothetical protein [Myxococcales bacterium]
MRWMFAALVAILVMFSLPSASAVPLSARGASNVSGEVRLRSEQGVIRAELDLLGISPGRYRVLLLPFCPPEPRPLELRTGEVPMDRREGQEHLKLEMTVIALGSMIVSDRSESKTVVSYSDRDLERLGSAALAIRELDVNPALADAYGLIACTPIYLGDAGSSPEHRPKGSPARPRR